jgi:hypothetical protein
MFQDAFALNFTKSSTRRRMFAHLMKRHKMPQCINNLEIEVSLSAWSLACPIP